MSEIEKTGAPCLSRRTFLGAAAAAGATAAAMAPWSNVEAEIARLKDEGWTPHPVACNMCGGYCGMLAMHKDGTEPSFDTVRIYPNPSHPQRGYCARGSSAMYVWNSPIRLKKPMKRTGERGEGKFVEVSWDEALNDIAKRVKEIVEKHGEHAVAMTSHNFSALQNWFGFALGTPNIISHSSTCNSASVMGRRLVLGKGFDGAGKVEPDYANCRYLLLIGRTLNCAMGVQATFAEARKKGCRVVFVDPRMPESAFGDAEWLPIRPGTDSAFVQGLLNVAVRENLVDLDFLARHTNAPYLIKADGKPLTEADMVEGGAKNRYAAFDKKTSAIVWRGVEMKDGKAVGFAEDPASELALDWTGDVTTLSGATVRLTTAWNLFMAEVNRYTPEEAAKITGIKADDIVRVARDFFTLGGVCDDGWYSSRCGNDCEAYALITLLNAFAGNFDKKGGFVVTSGGGFKGPGVSMGKGPQGQKWTLPDTKRLDRVFYPEGSGTFSAIFDAVHTGKPYPVRAFFITGTTMFHREANSARLAEALKALDLVVVQDIFPHEVIDYADYVLPSTFFLEWDEYAGVKWALNGNVQKNCAGLQPPKGNESRHEIWQFCEILRRAFPERAAERLGYDHEMSYDEFRAWQKGMMEAAWKKFIDAKNAAKPGEGDRIAREVAEQGWSQTAAKKYGQYPFKKPFGTATGKIEIMSFLIAEKYPNAGLPAVPTYQPVEAFRIPKARSDEFYFVSGKDSSASSGVTLFTQPSKFLGDRSVWMNPVDAERLGLETGDEIEIEGLDNGVKGRAKVKVTNRVMTGSLFAYGFQGGVRTKNLPKNYEWVREGVNSHWFATGWRQPVCGNLANNSSVRVKPVK